eukprot:scaffold90032_cov20-Tisochrysis_lutea.AAC.1
MSFHPIIHITCELGTQTHTFTHAPMCASAGRINYVGVYTVPKDLLFSLVTRFNQVKVIRALGGHVGVASSPAWPPPELGFFISLCFPRVSLAWEWLNGRRLAPASSCCNPECHWEEMLKVRWGKGFLKVLFVGLVVACAASAMPLGGDVAGTEDVAELAFYQSGGSLLLILERHWEETLDVRGKSPLERFLVGL